MKKEILKIAKVKNEDEFYRKFPTEEAFMKAHKKEFKKAQMGMQMQGVGKMLNQGITDAKNMKRPNNMLSNSFNPMPAPAPAPIPQFIDPQSVGGMQNMESFAKQPAQDYFSSFKTPSNTPANTVPSPKIEVKKTNFAKIAGPSGKIIDGIQALKEEKKALLKTASQKFHDLMKNGEETK